MPAMRQAAGFETVPGIGLITATELVATIGDGAQANQCCSGRHGQQDGPYRVGDADTQ